MTTITLRGKDGQLHQANVSCPLSHVSVPKQDAVVMDVPGLPVMRLEDGREITPIGGGEYAIVESGEVLGVA